MELGAPGFDAPENVAFAIAGWLYGEGDFGRSIVLANSLGEDTDCTCATLGATMGIIMGEKALPDRWKTPLNDQIVTMCIAGGVWIPKTTLELTEKVIRIMPSFLGLAYCDIFAEGGMMITCCEPEQLRAAVQPEYMPEINSHCKDGEMNAADLALLSPYTVKYEFPSFRVLVDYGDSVYFRKGENRSIRIKVFNAFYLEQQQWVDIKAFVPDGVEMLNGKAFRLPLNNLSGACAETEFEMNVDGYEDGKLEVLIQIALVGRHSNTAVAVTLMRAPGIAPCQTGKGLFLS